MGRPGGVGSGVDSSHGVGDSERANSASSEPPGATFCHCAIVPGAVVVAGAITPGALRRLVSKPSLIMYSIGVQPPSTTLLKAKP